MQDSSGGYHTALYLGRGVPDAWLTPGQHLSVSNLTGAYNVSTGHRDTYGVAIRTEGSPGSRVVDVELDGHVPTRDVQVQLPALATAGVERVVGGSFDAATHTVTLTPGSQEARITLGPAGRPDVSVQAQSTVPGSTPRRC